MNFIIKQLLNVYYVFESRMLALSNYSQYSSLVTASLETSFPKILSARTSVLKFYTYEYFINITDLVHKKLTRNEERQLKAIYKYKPKYQSISTVYSLSEQQLGDLVLKIDNFINRRDMFLTNLKLKKNVRNTYRYKKETYNHSYYSLMKSKLGYLFFSFKVVFLIFCFIFCFSFYETHFLFFAEPLSNASTILNEVSLSSSDVYNSTKNSDPLVVHELRSVALNLQQISVKNHMDSFVSLYKHMGLHDNVLDIGIIREYIEVELSSTITMDLSLLTKQYYQPHFVLDREFFSIIKEHNLISLSSPWYNEKRFLKDFLNSDTVEVIKQLHNLGFYTKNLGIYNFASTSSIILFINNVVNTYSLQDISSNKELFNSFFQAILELIYRYINMKFTLQQMSIVDSGLSSNTFILFSELQNHINDLQFVKGGFNNSEQFFFYVCGLLLSLLGLILIYLYIPLSSIISKVFSGLVIFLGSSGFVFLLIPDYSFFGLLIVIVYCSAIAILLIIAFFLLHSKFGISLENKNVQTIVFYGTVFVFIFYLTYLSSYWFSILFLNPSTEMVYAYIFSNLGIHIYNHIPFFSKPISLICSYNWYAQYGYLIDTVELIPRSDWIKSMSFLLMEDYVNFLQLNSFNLELVELANSNYDSVSIFQRLSLSLYGISYSFVIVTLGILLLIIFIILVSLLYRYMR